MILFKIGHDCFWGALLRQVTLSHGYSPQVVIEHIQAQIGYKDHVPFVQEYLRSLSLDGRLFLENQLKIVATFLELFQFYLVI